MNETYALSNPPSYVGLATISPIEMLDGSIQYSLCVYSKITANYQSQTYKTIELAKRGYWYRWGNHKGVRSKWVKSTK